MRLHEQFRVERQVPPVRSAESGGPAAAGWNLERTGVRVSPRAVRGVRLAKAKAAREGQSSVEKQGAMEVEEQSAPVPAPATPGIQKQLADLDATISRLNSDPDPEIQAIVAKRRAQREELVLQLRATIPLPVQLRNAADVRDRADQEHNATLGEVKSLLQLLALKRAELLEREEAAESARREYLRLVAATEGPANQSNGSQQKAAATHLAELLPPPGGGYVSAVVGASMAGDGRPRGRTRAVTAGRCGTPPRDGGSSRSRIASTRPVGSRGRGPIWRRLRVGSTGGPGAFSRGQGPPSRAVRRGRRARPRLTAGELRACRGLWDPRACPEFNRIAKDKRLEQAVYDAWSNWEWIPDNASIAGIVCYTDGSAKLNIASPSSGWGLVILAVAQSGSKWMSGLIGAACNAIACDPGHPEFIGARRHSAPVAELCALKELLSWMYGCSSLVGGPGDGAV